MAEQLEKKMSEEEVQEDVAMEKETSTVVDTGRKIDVSKVILKKNMVRVILAPTSDGAPIKARPRVHHKSKPKSKPKEIEVVRRPHQETGASFHESGKAPSSEPSTHVLRPEPTEWDDSGDFAAMLDASAPITKMEVNVGDRVRSRLIHVAGDTAFFSFGSIWMSDARR